MTTWLEHVKNVKKQNGGLQLKDILKLASKTYKKGGGDSSVVVPASEYEDNPYRTLGTPDSNQPVDPSVGGGKKKRRKSQKKRKLRNKSKKSRRRKTKKSRRKSSKK